MTSFDGRHFRHLQAEPKPAHQNGLNYTTANLVSRVKSTLASALRVASPALAVA